MSCRPWIQSKRMGYWLLHEVYSDGEQACNIGLVSPLPFLVPTRPPLALPSTNPKASNPLFSRPLLLR